LPGSRHEGKAEKHEKKKGRKEENMKNRKRILSFLIHHTIYAVGLAIY